MAGKPKGDSIKQKVFAWLDGNASVLNREQLHLGIVANFPLTEQTARVYASNWRKSNGVQRRYSKREELETHGN